MSLHSFDTDLAGRVGIAAAALHQNILLWARKNAVDRKYVRDGYVWIRSSRRAFSERYPYLSEGQIRVAIRKLVKAGLLVRGNFNSSRFDGTNWYALPESAGWLHDIDQKSTMGRK